MASPLSVFLDLGEAPAPALAKPAPSAFVAYLGWFCVATSVVLYLSPHFALQKARDKWEFVSRTLIGTLMIQTIHTSIWTLYGTLTLTIPLLCVSAFGVAVSFYFLIQIRTLLLEMEGEAQATVRASAAAALSVEAPLLHRSQPAPFAGLTS